MLVFASIPSGLDGECIPSGTLGIVPSSYLSVNRYIASGNHTFVGRILRFEDRTPTSQEEVEGGGLTRNSLPEEDWEDAAPTVRRYLQLADIALRDQPVRPRAKRKGA